VASRYEQGSILLTSNMAFSRWGAIFSDDIIAAAAMIDRLVHHAEVLSLAGDSYRTRARRALLQQQATNNTTENNNQQGGQFSDDDKGSDFTRR